ncbi:MAG: hypothetical protein ACXADW_21810 [Candidatus Hodarchaeales archaeon]|jgi:hypothetical protein
MEKRSSSKRDSKRVKVSDEKLSVNKAPETVRLILLKDLKLNVIGKVTGKRYHFSGGGSQLDVDKQDAEIMLKKRSGVCGNCPSSVGPTPYFEIIE